MESLRAVRSQVDTRRTPGTLGPLVLAHRIAAELTTPVTFNAPAKEICRSMGLVPTRAFRSQMPGVR